MAGETKNTSSSTIQDNLKRDDKHTADLSLNTMSWYTIPALMSATI